MGVALGESAVYMASLPILIRGTTLISLNLPLYYGNSLDVIV